MLQSIDTNDRPSATRPGILLTVWLLLASQLFLKPHGLEQLQDPDTGGHDEHACLTCALGPDLDPANIDTVAAPDTRPDRSVRDRACGDTLAALLLVAYKGRAPPSSPPLS